MKLQKIAEYLYELEEHIMPDDMKKRYLKALTNVTGRYSGSTVVKLLPFIEQDETLPEMEKLINKELPEKEFLKELKVIKNRKSI